MLGEDVDEKKPTTFEWVLYGWLCLNVADVLWLILAGTTPVRVYGSGWVAWVPPTIFAIVLGFFLWRLLKPTWITLGLAALFYLFQVVNVHLPDAAYGIQLGLCVNFRVTDDPNFDVQINVFAIVVAFLYGLAAYHRFEEEYL